MRLWRSGYGLCAVAASVGGLTDSDVGAAHAAVGFDAENEAGAQMFLPATKQFGPTGANLVVRSKLPPAALATSVMSALREMNPP